MANMEIDQGLTAEGVALCNALGGKDLETFTISGQKPQNLLKHLDGHEFVMCGVSPKDACDLFGGMVFDYSRLRTEFLKVCLDFNTPMRWEIGSTALHFAIAVVYKIGPGSREAKKTQDTTWKLRFIQEADEKGNKIKKINTVWVSTFKYNKPPVGPPTLKDHKLVLTLKQASLLATEILSRLVFLALTQKVAIMTPLAGAVFSKDDICRLAHDLYPTTEISLVEIAKVTIAIIESAQSAGHYLQNSDCSIAVVCAVAATRNIKDQSIANSIIIKTYKQYTNSGRVFSYDRYKIFSKYATGGIPFDFTPEKLREIMSEEQSTLRRTQIKDLETSSSVKEYVGLVGVVNISDLADKYSQMTLEAQEKENSKGEQSKKTDLSPDENIALFEAMQKSKLAAETEDDDEDSQSEYPDTSKDAKPKNTKGTQM